MTPPSTARDRSLEVTFKRIRSGASTNPHTRAREEDAETEDARGDHGGDL